MRHRSRAVRALTAVLAAPVLLGALPAESDVIATVTGLRSDKGLVVACLTARPDAFPDCQHDPAALAVKVPAHEGARIAFAPVAPGRYAIALFHDENANGRLDKRLMVPREGYGFSRDAPVRFGPPSFKNAAFAADSGQQHLSIRMRYIF